MCDVRNGYHQTPVAASEQDKTDFITQNSEGKVGLQTPTLWYSSCAVSVLASTVASFRTL